MEHHYLEGRLEFIIGPIIDGFYHAVEKYKDTDVNGSIIDNDDLEFLYGSVIVVLQNYINYSIGDFIKAIEGIVVNNNYIIDEVKERRKKMRKHFMRNGDKIQDKYTNIELIWALGNSLKHRDELEYNIEKLNFNDNPKEMTDYVKSGSYIKDTKEILNSYGLLETNDWELYPVLDGIEILNKDYNVREIYLGGREWRKGCWISINSGEFVI